MIVLDASVVVSAALVVGGVPERAVERALAAGPVALSRPVLAEMMAVLARPRIAARLAPGRAAATLETLLRRSEMFDPAEAVADCRDAKDNMYLELALAARADAIVSGDADLLVLDPWRGVRVVSPAAFVAGGA